MTIDLRSYELGDKVNRMTIDLHGYAFGYPKLLMFSILDKYFRDFHPKRSKKLILDD